MSIFKNGIFTRLFLASLASQLGTTIGNMAFAFYLLDRFAHQPNLAAAAELMYALPTLFVFLFTGVLADRVNRQKIAIWSDWIRAGLTVLLLIAVFYNSLFVIFLILFLRAGVSKFFAPAEMAILQGVLQKEEYQKAAGLNQMLFSVFMIFGMGMGALAYQTIGIQGAVVIDGISFVISALLIQWCRISQEVNLPNGPAKMKDLYPAASLRDFREGLLYVGQNKLLLSIIIGFFFFGFINGALAIIPLYSMKFKLEPEHYQWYASLFSIFVGIGFIIGSSIGTMIANKVKPYVTIIFGLFVTGLLIGSMGYISNTWIYFLFTVLTGAFLAPLNVAFAGWLPSIVDPKLMGRVNGLIEPVMMLAQSAALGVIAAISPTILPSPDGIYLLIGIVLLAVGIYYLIVLPALSRKNEASLSTEAEIKA
ncbi:MFS transporter [Metabacillus sp. RGM 3146]|uniref:MFS transporter n=1 Tax=Metabacillus sp. RGM 3146 TaxID=3401092 RepID=UPI003B9C5564